MAGRTMRWLTPRTRPRVYAPCRKARPEMMLSVLGVTGLTAYFGLLDLGDPPRDRTGLRCGRGHGLRCRADRQAGCRVVGIAGGPEKCGSPRRRALITPLTTSRATSISRLPRPAEVERVLHNVGGDTLEAALNHLNMRSRVVMCVV